MYPDRRIADMELFLHGKGEEVDVVEVDGTVVVAAFIDERGEDAEVDLWLEDADAPLARDSALVDSGVTHHAHLHLSRSKKIDTFVAFNGDTKDKEFGPNSTFKRVFNWATSKDVFPMDAEQKAKHTLEIAGTEIEPEMTEHIDRYANDDVLRLNLVPKDRHAG
jgi:hypothetical protein